MRIYNPSADALQQVAAISVAPTVEPISLAEAKEQIRLDSESFADDLSTAQSLVPAQWAVGTHNGSGVDVSGSSVLVNLDVGTLAATATLDVTIQESDDDVTYTDWGTAFTQVTVANDNAVYEKEYTGTKQYVRAKAVVANDVADFSVTVIEDAATSAEDTYIGGLITMAREWVEQYTGRRIMDQTWLLYLDSWPQSGAIVLPFGTLQSVTYVKYTDSDGTQNTWDSSEYTVDTDSVLGRIVPSYGEVFPTYTPATVLPIEIKFVCGYGATSASVPEPIRIACRMLVADYYEQRESRSLVTNAMFIDTRFIERMLMPYRVFSR